ncbi:hypothetical protein SAMN05216582_103144 [Selenomonas ruminantium]|uniref:Glycine zipper 2TM domain-containing protein n=1 Tax=Selenomonas ruminantium TaxID=971 RepID=A0A1M6S6Q9_SELRU|nr:hypothetical protein [Selenomonas ruminantium]SHK40375.1 hypothetical protein SAMN05216582_103144 [Selenomonas ruminantium]
MLSKKNVKMTAIALAGFVSLGIGGIMASAAEASPFHTGHDYEVQELANKHHRYHPKKYSEGDRNTAAIVGAVVGAVIAKNT